MHINITSPDHSHIPRMADCNNEDTCAEIPEAFIQARVLRWPAPARGMMPPVIGSNPNAAGLSPALSTYIHTYIHTYIQRRELSSAAQSFSHKTAHPLTHTPI